MLKVRCGDGIIRLFKIRIVQHPWFHPLLLLFWILVGAILRFASLEVLPPWTDEFATMVFSLGNGFLKVPLNQFIDIQTLLTPLKPLSDAGVADVIDRLFTESTHPPLYFLLTHFWLKLFPLKDGLVSLWGARSLSVIFGILAIPTLFSFGKWVFASRIVGQMMAMMMAVSPFGIFLAQQARHYTLMILLIIASLACFVRAIQGLHHQKKLPLQLSLAWVIINSLGMGTHYFFVLTLASEGLYVLLQLLLRIPNNFPELKQPYWQQLYGIGLGTLAGCLVWLPVLQSIHGSSPTDWVYDSNPWQDWLSPLGRLLLWVLSMVWLLPSSLQTLPLAVIIGSGIVTLLLVLITLPLLRQGIRRQQEDLQRNSAIAALMGYFIVAIALYLLLTYGLRMDLTLVPRFHFVYFPAAIALFAVALAGSWQNPSILRIKGLKIAHTRVIVTILALISLGSGLTMTENLGYLQNHRPDLMISTIKKASQIPVFIATTHRHHGQTGRMMGLAWGFKDLDQSDVSPQFFLATQNPQTSDYYLAMQQLDQQLMTLSRPFDLWLINFRADFDPASRHCFADSKYRGFSGQYKYKLYHCLT